MKFCRTILICITLCAMATAETAIQFFNPAAKEYIYGNTPVASNLVTQALTRFPDDEKLQKLKKLIDEQQQQKKNQQQQNQDKQNKDQKKDQDKQKDQQQNQQDQDKQQKDQQKQPDQNKEQSKPDQNKKQPSDQQQQSQPRQAGEMSKEEAQQLLDAMKQDEQDQRVNLKPYLGGPVRVEKDW